MTSYSGCLFAWKYLCHIAEMLQEDAGNQSQGVRGKADKTSPYACFS